MCYLELRLVQCAVVAASAAAALSNPDPVASAPQQYVWGTPVLMVRGSSTERQPGSIGIAVLFKISSASACVSRGRFWAISATTPATCGTDALVPPPKKWSGGPPGNWPGPKIK